MKPSFTQTGHLYRQARSGESEETLFQLVMPATKREVALKGCHDEVGHLGLECILDLMHVQFFWPCMAAQAKKHIGKCHPCLAFKAKQPIYPLENIMAKYPLDLVHLDYLCLEPGKGLEENILVVTNHFTRYAQAYVTRTQTTQTTAKTYRTNLLSSMGYPRSWWEHKRYRTAHTIHRLMASVRDSTPLWLVCWECYPQRRSQSGRTTLECWFTPTIAPKTQLWGSAPTISCTEDNPAFQ